MEIVDEILGDFKIRVSSTGFDLIKTGKIESGPNKGKDSEIVEGFYGKTGPSIRTMFAVIIHGNLHRTKATVTLRQFLEGYKSEVDALTGRLNQLISFNNENS